MWNRETVLLHVYKYKVLKNSLCSELNQYEVERKCSYIWTMVSRKARALASLPDAHPVQTVIGRMVDKSKKPRHWAYPWWPKRANDLRNVIYLYIMSTYICIPYICAIYLRWAKRVCIEQSLLYSSTLHSSTGHSWFLCSLILFCVLFTQLWSGINSWFWHTLWVSTLYCTSTDGSTSFVYDSRDMLQGLHSRDMTRGICLKGYVYLLHGDITPVAWQSNLLHQ